MHQEGGEGALSLTVPSVVLRRILGLSLSLVGKNAVF